MHRALHTNLSKCSININFWSLYYVPYNIIYTLFITLLSPRMRWLDGITDWMDMSLRKLQSRWCTGKPSVLQSMGSQRVGHDWVTELNWIMCLASLNSLKVAFCTKVAFCIKHTKIKPPQDTQKELIHTILFIYLFIYLFIF